MARVISGAGQAGTVHDARVVELGLEVRGGLDCDTGVTGHVAHEAEVLPVLKAGKAMFNDSH